MSTNQQNLPIPPPQGLTRVPTKSPALEFPLSSSQTPQLSIPIKVLSDDCAFQQQPQLAAGKKNDPTAGHQFTSLSKVGPEVSAPFWHTDQQSTQTNGFKHATSDVPHLGKTINTSYARELRDSGLSERQKFQNRFQTPFLADRTPPPTINKVFQKHQTSNGAGQHPSAEVDDLIREMEWKLKSGGYTTEATVMTPNDYCTKCKQAIVGSTPGVTALGNAYHVSCFCCDECKKQLAGCSFYSVEGKNLCQVDYMNSLEKCEKCLTPITQKILRALGKAFHPDCFVCPSCDKSLDGIPFTVDKSNTPYCLDCYHERFSPRCAVCLKAIAPANNETEVARVIAMEKSYHIDCYKCEDCGLKLNSKIEGQGCYPLESHLFCKGCNLKRLKAVK